MEITKRTFLLSPLAVAVAMVLSAPPGASADEADEADEAAETGGMTRLLPEGFFAYWPVGDLDPWDCSLCPDVSGWSGDVTAGIGYVTKDSPWFGRYTGFDEEGAYFLGSATARYRGEDGSFFDLNARDVGLDTRSIGVRGGERGRYRAYLNYHRIPGFVAQDPATVFRGVGSTNLRLPADWVAAPTTGGMAQLDESLADVRLGKDRDTLAVGVDLFRDRTWQYGVEYRRIEQDGFKKQGASFLTTASILPMPIDRVTDQIEARAVYLQETWHAIASYHGSFFNNHAAAVTWDNPFTPFTDGADRGRIAQEPDNRFHQVTLAGVWRPTSRIDSSARVAIGRMEQDDAFIAPTINPAIAVPGLPRADLAGRVDTLTGNLRAVYSAGSRLTITGEGYYDDRDNRTGSAEYTQVVTDSFIGSPRVNRPYSYERLGGRLIADFRPDPDTRLSAGSRAEQVKRTHQEVDKTETTEFWGELRVTPGERLDASLRLTLEERILVDPYSQLPDLTWEENPLLRKFHLADRDRKQARANLSYLVSDRVSVSVSGDYAKDDFDYSQVGLTDARDVTYTVDVSAAPRDNVTMSAFYTHETIDSNMASSAAFGVPDWRAEQKDKIQTLGLTVEARDVGRDGLDTGISYAQSYGRGAITMQTGAPVEPLPDLRSRLNSVKLYGRYRISEQLSVRVDYIYERYRTSDFQLDGVAPDTIPNVLTLGDVSPDYSVHFIGTSLNYRF